MTQEQWMQVLAIVGPMMLSGTVMIGSATWYLAGRIERVRGLASQVADISPKVADLSVRMAAAEARIDAMDTLARERREDETAFRTEMRTMVNSLLSVRAPLTSYHPTP